MKQRTEKRTKRRPTKTWSAACRRQPAQNGHDDCSRLYTIRIWCGWFTRCVAFISQVQRGERAPTFAYLNRIGFLYYFLRKVAFFCEK